MWRPDADFSDEEFHARWDRARAKMEASRMDAIVISSEMNYVYFTGHRSDQNKVDHARPYVFLLPREGEPMVFTMAFEAGHLEQRTPIKHHRSFPLFGHARVITDAIRDMGLADAVIGWELGREQYMGMSVNDYLEIRDLLPGAKFVDAAQLLLDLRAVKSQQEVSYVATAASATAAALDVAFEQIEAGMSERDVHELVAREIVMRTGDGPTDMRVHSGKDHTGNNLVQFARASRKLEVGDSLTVDTGVRINGYACDIARMGVIGEATEAQYEMHQYVFDLNRYCWTYLRPGNLCSDVARACTEELKKSGKKKSSAGRIGHGVGIDCLEFPSLAEDDDTVIEEGMVFSCNVAFPTTMGYFNIEENLVVESDGVRILADLHAPRDLRIIG